METDNKFKTKTGFCHILPDKIILTRDGVIGNVAEITVGNGIAKTLIVYTIISIYSLYSAYSDFNHHLYIFSFFYFVLGIFFIYVIFKSMNNSATPIIERNKIKDVKFFSAKAGLTRSRFEIIFEDENGNQKKRLIILPGSLNDGEKAIEKAIEMMKTEKILT